MNKCQPIFKGFAVSLERFSFKLQLLLLSLCPASVFFSLQPPLEYLLFLLEQNCYFVSTIVLTYCEKKLFLYLVETLFFFILKAECEESEISLRSIDHFIRTVNDRYNFWNNVFFFFYFLPKVSSGLIHEKI